MNQLHLLRLLIPAVKSSFKVVHPKEKTEKFIKNIKPYHTLTNHIPIEIDVPASSNQSLIDLPPELSLKS